MKFSKVIADIGAKVAGDSDIANSLDALSSLDHVRKLAYTNNYEDLDVDHPVLAMDNLDPKSTLLYEHPDKHLQLNAGHLDIFKLDGLCLLGGCMLDTKRTCLPVTILYNKMERMVVLHSGQTEMSILESEMYDHAFSKQNKWECQVLSETEVEENLARQRESTIESRNIGLDKIPKGFVGDKNVTCCREGVLPLLSLRCFQNEGEYNMVNTAVRRMLRVVPPVCDDDVLSTKWPQAPISFYSFWETSVPQGERGNTTDEVVSKITNRPILATVAYAVLQYANAEDVADERDENISKFGCTVPVASSHTEIVLSAQKLEKKQMNEFKQVKVTDLWESNTSDQFQGRASRRHVSQSTYSLKEALKNMGRIHNTVLLANFTNLPQVDVAQHVARTIATAIFKEGHDKDAIKYFNSLPHQPLTAFSSICKLAKCLDESQALLVVDREEDGRLGRVVLASAGEDIENVNKQSFARIACLFPWVRVLIVDKNKVSLLCVKEPDYVQTAMLGNEYMFVRKELRSDDVMEPEDKCVEERDEAGEMEVALADKDDVTKMLNDVRQSMQEIKCSNDALVVKNNTLEESIKQLSEKVDTLSENVSSAVTIASEKNVTAMDTAMDKVNENVAVSKTLAIFESVMSVTGSLHKRIWDDIST